MNHGAESPPAPAAPPSASLVAARTLFVERWSSMAASWGVPRSMAEVHALLFAEGRPMAADELVTRLGISRGNASMTVRTLVDWGIVRRIAVSGSRKELFVAEQDALALFATVIRVRKQREIDPLLTLVEGCRSACPGPALAAPDPELAAFVAKLDDIALFARAADRFAASLVADGDGLRAFVRQIEAGR